MNGLACASAPGMCPVCLFRPVIPRAGQRYRWFRETCGGRLCRATAAAATRSNHPRGDSDRELLTTPLPGRPLADAIVRWNAQRWTRDEAAAYLGIHDRLVTAWRSGQQMVTYGRADDVIVRMGLLWWDVWNEDTVRVPLVRVRCYRQRRWRASHKREAVRTVDIGDGGPDLVTLAFVRRTFEGDPVQVAA